jgi:bifunctional oligoribonuclease and PAP phosphatase NrnA
VSQPPPDVLVARLREASRLLLTSHTSPDGDAIGTELGLARLLEDMGKGVTIWNRDPAPAPLSGLSGADRIHVGETPPAGFPERFDTVVFLECPSIDRCGLEDSLSGLPSINLDHHLGNQLYGDLNWVDTTAPAVGEMVFRLAETMHLRIDETAADLLHLALVSDTGSFRYSNATPEAFESAARMVRAGASPERVARTLYDQRPLASLKLLAEVTSALELSAQGAVATVVLTRAMFERAGAGKGDSEGLVDTLRSLAGVEAVALLREIGERELKVSLRSRGRIDVESIARRRGGGGHRNAAGCTMSGEAEALRAELAVELEAALAAAGS